ncbi:hypothetical protein ES703_95946 [subsurface metagenome]
MPYNSSVQKAIRKVPPEAFKRHWAGYATTKCPYQIKGSCGVACVTVLADEPVVKQRGCSVSASRQKNVCAILEGLESLSFWRRTICLLLKDLIRCGSMARILPPKWPNVSLILPSAICRRCVSATLWASSRVCMAGSVAINGSPLASSNPFWLIVLFWRIPFTHKALSLTSCRANRGSTFSPATPLQL